MPSKHTYSTGASKVEHRAHTTPHSHTHTHTKATQSQKKLRPTQRTGAAAFAFFPNDPNDFTTWLVLTATLLACWLLRERGSPPLTSNHMRDRERVCCCPSALALSRSLILRQVAVCCLTCATRKATTKARRNYSANISLRCWQRENEREKETETHTVDETRFPYSLCFLAFPRCSRVRKTK